MELTIAVLSQQLKPYAYASVFINLKQLLAMGDQARTKSIAVKISTDSSLSFSNLQIIGLMQLLM